MRRALRLPVLLALLAGAAFAQPPAWHVGDHVEAWNVAWYPATVLEIGAGSMAGYYRVHYDQYAAASDQWLTASSRRARPAGAAAAAGVAATRAAGPRLGRYRVLSFGAGGSAIALGAVELLAGGHYRATLPGGRAAGEGRWRYDAATASVRWLSGPYRDDGWGGAFTVEREGKTHQLRLRGGTVAVNSTDG